MELVSGEPHYGVGGVVQPPDGRPPGPAGRLLAWHVLHLAHHHHLLRIRLLRQSPWTKVFFLLRTLPSWNNNNLDCEYEGSQKLLPKASAAFSITLRLFLIYPWTLDLGCWFTLGPELPSSWKAVQRLAPMWTHMLAHSDRHQNCLAHHTSLQNLLCPLWEALPKQKHIFHIFFKAADGRGVKPMFNSCCCKFV